MIGILTLMLLAAAPEAADPAIGVLVVVADRQIHEGEYRPLPQKLTSYWLEATPSHAAEPVAIPGLVIPFGTRFLRFGIERDCVEMADAPKTEPAMDTHDCRESLVEWPMEAAEPKTSAHPWRGNEDGPCAFNQLFVTFASPAVISLEEYRGHSESCEPRGYRWSERGFVRRVGDLAEVSLEWFLGDVGARAYETAAKGPFLGEGQQPCEAIADDSGWYITRERTKWVPVLKQQGPTASCIMEAPIKVDLPPVAIGFADPPLRWPAVKKLFPDATQAHGSPQGPADAWSFRDARTSW